MELKESQRKRVCRICHQESKAKGPGDPFVFDFGKEHAHQSCLCWEEDSKKKIEEKEMEPITIGSLVKEIEILEEAKKIFTKDIILLMLDGQTEIRKRFIETLKKLEEERKSYLATIHGHIDRMDKKTTELQERHDLLIEEIKRITGCTDEDIEFYLGMPGQVRKPIINVKMGEEIQRRFDLEDEIKRKDAKINEAISILKSGNNYEEPDIINILRNGLSK